MNPAKGFGRFLSLFRWGRVAEEIPMFRVAAVFISTQIPEPVSGRDGSVFALPTKLVGVVEDFFAFGVIDGRTAYERISAHIHGGIKETDAGDSRNRGTGLDQFSLDSRESGRGDTFSFGSIEIIKGHKELDSLRG